MIQVLQRAAEVLDLLAAEEPLSLKELTERTGFKKPTLCLILKSLVELGLAEKRGTGIYATGPALRDMAFRQHRRRTVQGLAEEAVAHLAERIRESVVAAVVHRNRRYTIAMATFQQALMVDTRLQARGTFFNSATGRILLAYMPENQRETVLATDGLPPREAWPEATTPQGLCDCLEKIRKAGIETLPTHQGAIHFLAAPVFGPGGTAWLALGVSLPTSRFAGAHRTEVVQGLRSEADDLGQRLALASAWAMPTEHRTIADPRDDSIRDPKH